MIEDFIIPKAHTFGLPIRAIDYKRIVELPDDNFALLYLELMSEYPLEENGKVRKCFECLKPISSVYDLRRFYGQSLHPECYRNVYEGWDKVGISEINKKFFERVLELKI